MTTRQPEDDDGVNVDRLYEILEEAEHALSYEEREAIADALRAGDDDAPTSPRAREFLAQIRDRLREVEGEKGHGPPWFPWIQLAWEYLIEPSHGKRPQEMSRDELEHEIERRRKYHPREGEE